VVLLVHVCIPYSQLVTVPTHQFMVGYATDVNSMVGEFKPILYALLYNCSIRVTALLEYLDLAFLQVVGIRTKYVYVKFESVEVLKKAISTISRMKENLAGNRYTDNCIREYRGSLHR